MESRPPNMQVGPRLGLLDRPERVAVPRHLELDAVVTNDLQEHPGVGAAFGENPTTRSGRRAGRLTGTPTALASSDFDEAQPATSACKVRWLEPLRMPRDEPRGACPHGAPPRVRGRRVGRVAKKVRQNPFAALDRRWQLHHHGG